MVRTAEKTYACFDVGALSVHRRVKTFFYQKGIEGIEGTGINNSITHTQRIPLSPNGSIRAVSVTGSIVESSCHTAKEPIWGHDVTDIQPCVRPLTRSAQHPVKSTVAPSDHARYLRIRRRLDIGPSGLVSTFRARRYGTPGHLRRW